MKRNTIFGISVLPALLIMPAMGDVVTTRTVISSDTTYTNLVAENIASTTANNGGVFYMQDVPNVALIFDGDTLFSGNSLNNGGMGGAIGNGWLSSTTGAGYTVGGKIVFNGASNFAGNTTNNPNGGGAIFNYGAGNATNPDIIFVGPAVFGENKATGSMTSVYVGGGAINHREGMIVFNNTSSFANNQSATKGGAIMTAGDIIFNGAAQFIGNSAGTSGGALAILGGAVEFEGPTTFSNNTAAGASAILMDQSDSSLVFKDTAIFSGNTGVGTLLNNNASGTVSFARGAEFSGNTNNYNGALVNVGTVSLTGGDFIFSANTGSNGGGLKNSGTLTANTSGQVLFNNNSTSSTAGALDNGGTIGINAPMISFQNNSSAAGYGGAIFNAADMNIIGSENVFRGNIAHDTGATKSGGGAIHNRGNTGAADLVIGVTNGTNLFDSNTSMAHGGAIVSRAFDGATQDSHITINGTTRFVGNQSTLNGGAIWNSVAQSDGTVGTAEIVFNGTTSFINNHAGEMGGALYNNDTITFNGNTTFRGNTANGIANDIHNDGTINFMGNTTIVGGVTGAGTLNIASGTTFDIGASSVTQGSIALNGIMLATLRGGNTGQINVTNANGFSGNGLLKLAFDSAGTYRVFGNQIFANVDISSPLYDLTWNGGDVTATVKSASDIATQNNLSESAARTVASVAGASSVPLHDLSVLIQTHLASDTDAARSAVESAVVAINPETAPVSRSVGMGVQNALNSVISDRLSMLFMGRNGGDINLTSSGIWAQGLYNKSKLNDAFNAYTRGVSVGIDGMFGESLTLGVGYLFGHSNIGANARNSDVDSHSFFVYGQYQPANWYVNATMNYTMSDYSENGSALGINVTSDYDMDAFGANVAMGYDFFGGITPEVSLRYMYLDSVRYTNSLGITNKIDHTDYLTAAIGTRYEFDLLLNNGWVLRPGIRYAVKYDLISDDNRALVSMPGVDAYIINGDGLSRIANTVGVTIGMMYGALDMSLNYDIEARADYTSQTGRVKFRYEF